MSTKFSGFMTPSPLSAFGTDANFLVRFSMTPPLMQISYLNAPLYWSKFVSRSPWDCHRFATRQRVGLKEIWAAAAVLFPWLGGPEQGGREGMFIRKYSLPSSGQPMQIFWRTTKTASFQKLKPKCGRISYMDEIMLFWTKYLAGTTLFWPKLRHIRPK